MSFTEGEPYGGGPPEGSPSTEREPAPYLRAARFARTQEAVAARVYAQAQDAIHRTPCNVSVYRLLLDGVTHVAAVGALPPPRLDATLTQLLAAGESVTLPPTVVQALLARRAQAQRLGPWVEGHHRPDR
jgi:hypothetical protein